MPEPTREELLKERARFNLREHLQSLKDVGAKIVAVTEQEISKLADELSGKSDEPSAEQLSVGEEIKLSPESLGLPADNPPVAGSGIITEVSGNSFTVAFAPSAEDEHAKQATPAEREIPNAD